MIINVIEILFQKKNVRSVIEQKMLMGISLEKIKQKNFVNNIQKR
ncbi:Uncharacterised protein [Mycobacterium tuberculosis]|nr:Uncharacterised protein [Mycobacterium tuberculosis]